MNPSTHVQVIMKDGEPEYAILPYAHYQALLEVARTAKPAEQTTANNQQAAESPVSDAHLNTHALNIEAATTPAATARITQASSTSASTAPTTQTTAIPSPTTETSSASTTESDANSNAPFSGEKVAQLRNQKGMDSKTLARGVGISPLYMAQIETGERSPGDVIWHNIARELQVNMNDLRMAD